MCVYLNEELHIYIYVRRETYILYAYIHMHIYMPIYKYIHITSYV